MSCASDLWLGTAKMLCDPEMIREGLSMRARGLSWRLKKIDGTTLLETLNDTDNKQLKHTKHVKVAELNNLVER